MPRTTRAKLRDIIRTTRHELVPEATPRTAAALASLETALAEEYGTTSPAASARKNVDRRVKAAVNRTYYQKRRRTAIARELQALKKTRVKGVLALEWQVRVAMLPPQLPARTVCTVLSELLPEADKHMSRDSINKVRDAFVELLKELAGEALRAMIRRAMTAAVRAGAGATAAVGAGAAASARVPLSAILVHLHDEAALRLRSHLMRRSEDIPSRSRSSKVQQHVMTFHTRSGQIEIPTELEALANKTSATVATSLDRVLRGFSAQLASAVLKEDQAEADLPWLVHVIVGDGVATNEAACRRLWARARKEPLAAGRLRYFLAVYKCSTHQANLAAKSAVVGAAAVAAAATTCAEAGREPHTVVCGVVTRLYKYLVNDYFEEFATATYCCVRGGGLTPQPQPGARAEEEQQRRALQQLYGESVLSNELLKLLNTAAQPPPESADPDLQRETSAAALARVLVRTYLVVDEHPTPTRFWTFRDAIDRLLGMTLLGIHDKMLRQVTKAPRAENQRRLLAVRGFLLDPGAQQYLRRCSLCLQLTGIATSITGQTAAPRAVPLLVRLGQRAVQTAVSARLRELLVSLHEDPELDKAAALTSLLATAADIELRFAQYEGYPTALWKVTAAFNPEGYPQAALDFIGARPNTLDVGFSLQLHAAANSAGNDYDAVAFMTSDRVQSILQLFLESAAATTLEVERRHAQAKRSEQSRVIHMASASRNCLLRRFLAGAAAASAARREADGQLQRALRTNVQSLAWQELPRALPRHAAAPGAGQRACIGHAPNEGDSQALRNHISTNRDRLETAAQQIRADARTAATTAAGAAWLPTNMAGWVALLGEREPHFRDLIREATARRRHHSRRLEADINMPEPVGRLQPNTAASSEVTPLQKLLRGRSGWYLVGSTPPRLLFVAHYAGRLHSFDTRPLLNFSDRNTLLFGPRFSVRESLQPLESLGLPVGPVEVYQVAVQAEATLKGVVVWPTKSSPVTLPARREAAAAASVEGESEEDSMEEWRAKDGDEESAESVDTDVETAAEEDAEDQHTDSDSAVGAGAGEQEDPNSESPAAAMGAEPSGPRQASGTWVVWNDAYFFMSKRPDLAEVRISMYRQWYEKGVGDGLGRYAMSKSLTPSVYSESWPESAPKFQILLRAWACTRMAGALLWLKGRECRRRELAAKEAHLAAELRGLGEADRLLGNSKLNKTLKQWAPRIYEAALEAGPTAAVGAAARRHP